MKAHDCHNCQHFTTYAVMCMTGLNCKLKHTPRMSKNINKGYVRRCNDFKAKKTK